MQVSVTTLGVLCALITFAFVAGRPPAHRLPVWPDQFTLDILFRVEIYGPKWNSTGKIFYDWNHKTFRADFYKWCLPLIDTPTIFNSYSCSFFSTHRDLFFVNFTASTWEDDECCLFAKGLGPVHPNWMHNMHYNGTSHFRGISCDVWWKSGNSDPNNPCYGYWVARDPVHTPLQFFGLSSVGPTTLEFGNYDVGPLIVNLTIPNKGCHRECKPSGLVKLIDSKHRLLLPHFPSCD